MTAVTASWLESRPRGTVIRVTSHTGHHFDLVAEGGAFRDFVLHRGKPAQGLGGRMALYGGTRRYWSTEQLSQWTVDGLCTIELAPGGTR